jgi:hypothetical protein
MEITNLEQAVLQKLLNGDHLLLNSLRRQLEACRVDSREFTGAGFYTTFVLDEGVEERAGGDLKFGDVIAQIDGLKHGAGFLLYVKAGALKMLEGYSYDEPWPERIAGFKLSFMKGEERDWKALAKILDQAKS